jgi:hypothetical protein
LPFVLFLRAISARMASRFWLRAIEGLMGVIWQIEIFCKRGRRGRGGS